MAHLKKYWRLVVLALLLLVPVAFLGIVASVALYHWGWWVWAWWPMTACLVVALILVGLAVAKYALTDQTVMSSIQLVGG